MWRFFFRLLYGTNYIYKYIIMHDVCNTIHYNSILIIDFIEQGYKVSLVPCSNKIDRRINFENVIFI